MHLALTRYRDSLRNSLLFLVVVTLAIFLNPLTVHADVSGEQTVIVPESTREVWIDIQSTGLESNDFELTITQGGETLPVELRKTATGLGARTQLSSGQANFKASITGERRVVFNVYFSNDAGVILNDQSLDLGAVTVDQDLPTSTPTQDGSPTPTPISSQSELTVSDNSSATLSRTGIALGGTAAAAVVLLGLGTAVLASRRSLKENKDA